MLNKIKVSVIVPVYDVQKYLAKCLNSILNQSFSEYEIICVNDCSPDNSQAVLDKYYKKYPDRIRIIINKENLGLGLSRNRGIDAAQGEYIMFVDSDDYIKTDYIQRYYEYAREGKVDAVIGGYIRVSKSKETIHSISDNIWATLTYGISCAKMYRKDFLNKNNLRFSSYKCGEDVHFNTCAFCCSMTYKVIPYEGYYYVDNGKSITNTMNYKKNHEEIMMNIFLDVLEKYGNRICSDQKDVLEYVCYVNILNALLQFNRGCGVAIMKEKYAKCSQYMQRYFPNYIHNNYLRVGKPKGQTAKIRIATSIVKLLRNIKLDRILFYAISCINSGN